MIKDPKVTVKACGKDSTVVQASFLTYEKKGKRTTVLYDMLREDGRWMIDDIRGTVDSKGGRSSRSCGIGIECGGEIVAVGLPERYRQKVACC